MSAINLRTAVISRIARVATVGAVMAVLVAGCSSGESGFSGASDSSQMVVMPAEPAPMVPAAPGSTADMVSEAAVAGGGPSFSYEEVGSAGVIVESPQNQANREIIVSGSAEVYADNPSTAASEIANYVVSIGGNIASRREWRGSGNNVGGASLSVRVPAGSINSVLDGLSNFGEVRSISVDQWDVTAQGVDLDARIAALQTSVTRLTELLATAGDTGDLLQVERELSSRQAELDALRAARSDLSEQVAMSSLDLQIFPSELAQRVAEPRPGFLGGLQRGWQAFQSFLSGLAVAFGAALPFLLAIGILAAILTPLLRWLRRRRYAAAASSLARIGKANGRYQTPNQGDNDPES